MHKGRLIKLLGLTVLAAISVMAVSASAAQANYLLLLDLKSVSSITVEIEALEGSLKAENGLKISCAGGSGSATAEYSEGGKNPAKVVGKASGTFTGCKWVGSEKTCTINDGGAGNIKAAGTGEVVMPDASTYVVTASSQTFSTVITEGVFCTIPEEEEVSGSAHILIENALADTEVKLGKILALDLKLGNSKVIELNGEVHIKHTGHTFAIHLCNLGGPACELKG